MVIIKCYKHDIAVRILKIHDEHRVKFILPILKNQNYEYVSIVDEFRNVFTSDSWY